MAAPKWTPMEVVTSQSEGLGFISFQYITGGIVGGERVSARNVGENTLIL